MSSEVKENAKRAMRELFGSLTGEAIDMAEPEEAFTSELPEVPEVPEVSEEDIAVFQTPVKVELTKIGGDTVITGSVQSSGSVEIRGMVYGDIYSEENVYIYGHVVGNINCKNFYHYTGAVKGNVTATDNMEIGISGAILGDLRAVGIRLDGRVSGNITTTGKAELLENAVVSGDINTKYFTMKDTTCLRGVVHLQDTNRDVDSAFADCFDF